MSRGLFCPNCLRPVDADRPSCQSCGHVRPPNGWPADEYLGRVVNGKYRVTRKLGEGGFGVVLHARHIQRGDDLGEVVLKFLHPHLASQPQVRRRFVNEAKASRALRSPHVVKVFDFDFDERGLPFMVMEYLQGAPLVALLRRGALPPLRAVQIGIQVASALHECHQSGIVHRDLKPSNILLLPGKEDFVKLIDFGVARLPDASLTQTLLGTPKYMAPEQIQQKELDSGVDIFALGVVLFEALTGEDPIPAEGVVEYLQRNLSDRPLLLRELAPHLPQRLEELLDAMMAKERAARPATVDQVEDELRALLPDLEKIPAPSPTLAEALAEAPTETPAAARDTSTFGTPGSLAPVVTDSQQDPSRRPLRWRVATLVAGAGALVGAAVLGLVGRSSEPTPSATSRSADSHAVIERQDSGLDASRPDLSNRASDAAPPALTKKVMTKKAARRHKRPATKSKKQPKDPDDEFTPLPGGL